jgi:hypothetical protein
MNISQSTPEELTTWRSYETSRAGRVRDESGNPLSGFVVKNFKKTRKVSIVSNGTYLNHYRFPTLAEAPRHPMVSWRNLLMCGGFLVDDAHGNSLSNSQAIVEAVLAGRKPVGEVIMRKDSPERLPLIEHAKAAGFQLFERYPAEGISDFTTIMIGVNQPIAELFEFESIIEFYDCAAFIGLLDRYDVDSIKTLTPADCLRSYDWANPVTAWDLIRTGLCLGYAFESTLALMDWDC